METYEVTRKLLSLGPAYFVERTDAPSPSPLVTIKGKVLAMSPKLTMLDRDGRAELASMRGNFAQTKFECFDGHNSRVATLSFPLFAIKKGFTIAVGDASYKVDGGFLGGEFSCAGPDGVVVLAIRKQLAIRDKFAVSTNGALPRDVALLAAVAIDQKFFQEQ